MISFEKLLYHSNEGNPLPFKGRAMPVLFSRNLTQDYNECIKNKLLCFPTILEQEFTNKVAVLMQRRSGYAPVQKIVAKILKVTETLSLSDEPATKTT